MRGCRDINAVNVSLKAASYYCCSASEGGEAWRQGAGARCRYRHILDKIGPKVSKMCPKYVQTSLCAQNMPKMWPNIKIEPKLCSNTWYFFGHLYQGIWIMPKLQQNAQNLPFTCPNFSYILVTFWVQVQNIGKYSKTINLDKFWTKMSLSCAY